MTKSSKCDKEEEEYDEQEEVGKAEEEEEEKEEGEEEEAQHQLQGDPGCCPPSLTCRAGQGPHTHSESCSPLNSDSWTHYVL